MKTHTATRLLRPLVALCALGISLSTGIPAALAQDAAPTPSDDTSTTADATQQPSATATIVTQPIQKILFGIPSSDGGYYIVDSKPWSSGQYDTAAVHAVTVPSYNDMTTRGMWSAWPNSTSLGGPDHSSLSGHADFMYKGYRISSSINANLKYPDDTAKVITPSPQGGHVVASGGTITTPTFSTVNCTGANITHCQTAQFISFEAVYVRLARFDGNGATSGSIDVGYPTAKNGNMDNDWLYTIPKTPYTRTGYTFSGWNTAANGSGTWYQPGDVVNMGKLATIGELKQSKQTSLGLYAQWTLDPITVHYDGNGATGGSVSDQKTGRNVPITISQNGFTWANHEFLGWNTKSDGSGTSYKAGDKNAFGSNTTLYAQWKALKATIHYDGNGATGGSVADQTETIGSKVNAQQNGFTRGDTFIFKEWNTKSDGTGTSYQPGTSLTIPAQDMTLYAIWTPVSTTLMPPTGGSGLMLALGSGVAGLAACMAAVVFKRRRTTIM